MKAKATPKGYHTLNPILWVRDVDTALSFYRTVFAAREDFRRELHGRLLIVSIEIGDSRIMLSDVENDPKRKVPHALSNGAVELKLYLDNVDDVFRRAIQHGAKEQTALADQYFGERSGSIVDPFGFSWRLAEFLEDVPHEEIERRMRSQA